MNDDEYMDDDAEVDLLVELQTAHDAEVAQYKAALSRATADRAETVKAAEAKLSALAELHAREVTELKREIAAAKTDHASQTARLHELLSKALQEKAPPTVTIADGAIQVRVAPPSLTISEGAIQASILNEAQRGDLEIAFPDGRKTTLRRR